MSLMNEKSIIYTPTMKIITQVAVKLVFTTKMYWMVTAMEYPNKFFISNGNLQHNILKEIVFRCSFYQVPK